MDIRLRPVSFSSPHVVVEEPMELWLRGKTLPGQEKVSWPYRAFWFAGVPEEPTELFAIAGLWELSAWASLSKHDDASVIYRKTIAVPSGPLRVEVPLKGRDVIGKVLTPEGAPLQGARVLIAREDAERLDSEPLGMRTDENGQFHFLGLATTSTCRLIVTHPSYMPGSWPLNPSSFDQPQCYQLQPMQPLLRPPPAAHEPSAPSFLIRGVVRDGRDGTPMASAIVQGTMETDSDGSFSLHGRALPSRERGLLLTVQKEGFLPHSERVSIPAGETFHEVRLQPGGIEAIVSFQDARGEPLPAVEIALDDDRHPTLCALFNNQRDWSRSGESVGGLVRLRGLGPGSYALDVWLFDCWVSTTTIELAPAPARQEITARLEETMDELRARIAEELGDQ
jgi:hypothetical protein